MRMTLQYLSCIYPLTYYTHTRRFGLIHVVLIH
jgi:hypothetical protein